MGPFCVTAIFDNSIRSMAGTYNKKYSSPTEELDRGFYLVDSFHPWICQKRVQNYSWLFLPDQIKFVFLLKFHIFPLLPHMQSEKYAHKHIHAYTLTQPHIHINILEDSYIWLHGGNYCPIILALARSQPLAEPYSIPRFLGLMKITSKSITMGRNWKALGQQFKHGLKTIFQCQMTGLAWELSVGLQYSMMYRKYYLAYGGNTLSLNTSSFPPSVCPFWKSPFLSPSILPKPQVSNANSSLVLYIHHIQCSPQPNTIKSLQQCHLSVSLCLR